MDSLSKSLYTVVSQAVDEFAQIVSNKYSLSKNEVLELWNSRVANSDLKVVEGSRKEEKKVSAPRSKAKSDDSDSSTCSYEFKKGKNQGSKCTAKVCPDSSSFCRKHKEQENKESGEKDSKKPAASKAKKASEAKEKDTPAVKKLSEGKTKLALTKNKQGNYEHVETRLVFDKNTKEVIGRQSEKGIEDLTTEDIETCKSHSWKYRVPTTLTSKNNSKDVELEEEDEEEEEEVDEDDEDEDEEEDEDDD